MASDGSAGRRLAMVGDSLTVRPFPWLPQGNVLLPVAELFPLFFTFFFMLK